MSILLNKDTRVIVQGASGRQAQRHIPLMQSYGTKIVAGIAPGRRGEAAGSLDIFDTVGEAVDQIGAIDLSVVFVQAQQAAAAAIQSIESGIPTTVVLAEGVPFQDTVRMVHAASDNGVRLIGPNCQGIITPGEAKIGASGGRNPSRMFGPGRVGVVSRSGGMGAETSWLLSRAGVGQSTYVAVGGELISGTSFGDVALLFQEDEATDAIVFFGEPGTQQEEDLAQMIADKRVGKPVIAYVAGTFVEGQGAGRSYGHAGAVMKKGAQTPSAKRRALQDAGAHVAQHWAEIADLVRTALDNKRTLTE
jgi:succinyl-CoA synthetase alpha subunit